MVINVGLPKTGTTSMADALKALGYKTMHDHVGSIDETKNYSGGMSHRIDEIVENYKDAILINTTREIEKWLGSCRRHFSESRYGVLRKSIFGTLKYNREKFIETYIKHNEKIKKYGILMFEIGVDGWEKLCTYLGKEVIEGKFPYSNRRT